MHLLTASSLHNATKYSKVTFTTKHHGRLMRRLHFDFSEHDSNLLTQRERVC
jgi:hypothetical protein